MGKQCPAGSHREENFSRVARVVHFLLSQGKTLEHEWLLAHLDNVPYRNIINGMRATKKRNIQKIALNKSSINGTIACAARAVPLLRP